MVAPTAEAGDSFWGMAFLLRVPSNLLSFQMPSAAGSEVQGDSSNTWLLRKTEIMSIFKLSPEPDNVGISAG